MEKAVGQKQRPTVRSFQKEIRRGGLIFVTGDRIRKFSLISILTGR
jgi:hypothetical protein